MYNNIAEGTDLSGGAGKSGFFWARESGKGGLRFKGGGLRQRILSSNQAIRVLKAHKAVESEVITTVRQSLMKIMSNYCNYMLRMYVLLTPDEIQKRSAIEKRIGDDLAE